MKRRPLPATTLVPLAVATLLVLAGCGQATEATDTGAGSAAAPSSSAPTVDASLPTSDPTWPATGCANRVSSELDYAREPKGWKTPLEAVAHAPNLGLPDGTLVLAPAEAHTETQVWVVDVATNTILASVSVFPGSAGFFVDGVTTCA